MLGKTFYHSTIRRYISVFGNIFSSIYIRRVDSSGNRIQTIPVPIRYAAKQKYLEMLADPAQDKKVAIQLPFISFVMTSLDYDSTRQTSQLSQLSSTLDSDKNRRNVVYKYIPYKIGIEMSILAKNNDDISQIWEQIIPYFTPDHFNTVNILEGFPDVDMKIQMQSTSIEDSFEGQFTENRRIQWNLSFICDVMFAGPVGNQGVIKSVQVDYHEKNNPSRNERTIITPGLDINGNPVTVYEESIPYNLIEADDDYGFVERNFTFQDDKIFNPKTGEDE